MTIDNSNDFCKYRIIIRRQKFYATFLRVTQYYLEVFLKKNQSIVLFFPFFVSKKTKYCLISSPRPLLSCSFNHLQVTGLLTQGKGDDEEWVTSFELSYSLDAYHWHFARDIYNNKKVGIFLSCLW